MRTFDQGLVGLIQLREFVKKYGEPYSKLLGIKIAYDDDQEIVKWFLAAILYSKPIRESSATKTYRCFEKYNVLTAEKIVRKGWDGLVSILDEGGYTRYDFSTADKLLEVFNNLQKQYDGKLSGLYEAAADSNDLEKKLKALGKGIGDTTVSIFLRDMREVWQKANPVPSPLVAMGMQRLGVRDLQETARSAGVSIVRLETALLRLAKDFIKKGKELQVTI
jgi:hypothetical protein